MTTQHDEVEVLHGPVAGLGRAPIDHDSDPIQGDHPPEDPLRLAASWLPRNDDPDRPQITLGTIGRDGYPDARTVLLSEFDGEGFCFHTDAESRKVRELAANPRVSLVVLWAGFSRQLVVQGLAEVAAQDEIADAWVKRSPYLKQLAWQNTEEFAGRPLQERRALWSRFQAQHGVFPQPGSWVGFKVRAHRMVFWVSNPAAASRRLEYTRDGEGWARRYLPG